MEHFNNLKAFREDNDLKQDDIAQLIGVFRQQYARYENGAFPMPIQHYKRLAQYFNVSIDYLCGLAITPRTLTGDPYRISKNYIIDRGQIKREGE